MKRKIAPLGTAELRLRLLVESDLPLTLAWRNAEENRRWFFDSSIITPERHAQWFSRYLDRDDDFVFIIEAPDSRPVGQLALYNVDWQRGRCEFGRLVIGEPVARGHGFAAKGTTLALKQAFDGFRMNEVYIQVYGDNLPTLRLMEKCGFSKSGARGDVVEMTLSRAG